MTDVVYRVVEHDGGWAYRLGDVYSETFPNRLSAEAAAKRVAEEQRSPGEDEAISWEDEQGVWHDEAARGADRPNAYVASEAFEHSAPAQQIRSTERDTVARASNHVALLKGENNQHSRRNAPTARDQVRSDPIILMLLTIAFAYLLDIVFRRNA